jgi:hypothetical protein
MVAHEWLVYRNMYETAKQQGRMFSLKAALKGMRLQGSSASPAESLSLPLLGLRLVSPV